MKKTTTKRASKGTLKAAPVNGATKVTASPQATVTVAVADAAAQPVVTTEVPVSFSLFNPRARQVSLCSEFNAWSPEAAPMRRTEDGRWQATVPLQPGRYQYKFVVDGEWLPDPEARENVYNPHGTLNSVIEVQA